jgi:hypothetical protein
VEGEEVLKVLKKRRSKETIPERKHPGDFEPENCSPGSIEQQLDMCEQGPIKGDEIVRHTENRPSPNEPSSEDPMSVVEELGSFEITMSERDREGDEYSGDEHSAGLQGDEPELHGQPNISSGIPGESPMVTNGFDNVIDISTEREKVKKKVAKSSKKVSQQKS